MAHTDLLIFFNTAFWVFYLFLFIYFLILVIFSSNTYFRVRIFSVHRVFLMTCLLSFFQLGLVLSKLLHYFVIVNTNLLKFSWKLISIINYSFSYRFLVKYKVLILNSSKYLATIFFSIYI